MLDLGFSAGSFWWLYFLYNRMLCVPRVDHMVVCGVHLRRLPLAVAGRLVPISVGARLVIWIAFMSTWLGLLPTGLSAGKLISTGNDSVFQPEMVC